MEKANTTNRAKATFESRPMMEIHSERLDRIKSLAEAIWDEFDSIPVPPDHTEPGRYVSLAKTTLEETVMWATKAISRQDKSIFL